MKKKTKKKNLRSNTKNPALHPQLNLKSRSDEITDVLSYIDQLNDKEKAWMNSFVSEFVNADFKHGGKILHKGKKKRKICTDRNNARNRCDLTRAKASGTAVTLNYLSEADESKDNIDNIIDVIDLQRNLNGWVKKN